jgi:hypothetical protein
MRISHFPEYSLSRLGILSKSDLESFRNRNRSFSEIVIMLRRWSATSMSNLFAVSFLRRQDRESLMALFFSRALEQELDDGSSFLSKAKSERLHSD